MWVGSKSKKGDTESTYLTRFHISTFHVDGLVGSLSEDVVSLRVLPLPLPEASSTAVVAEAGTVVKAPRRLLLPRPPVAVIVAVAVAVEAIPYRKEDEIKLAVAQAENFMTLWLVVLCFRLFRFGFGLIVVAVAVVVAEVFVNFVFCFCYSRKEIVSKTNWIFGFDFSIQSFQNLVVVSKKSWSITRWRHCAKECEKIGGFLNGLCLIFLPKQVTWECRDLKTQDKCMDGRL